MLSFDKEVVKTEMLPLSEKGVIGYAVHKQRYWFRTSCTNYEVRLLDVNPLVNAGSCDV